MKSKSILAFVRYYLPGYKSGGPVKSIKNMAAILPPEFNFKIVTRDRDFLDNKPYPNINRGSWNMINETPVFYCPYKMFPMLQIRKLLLHTQYDIIYLNSFFSFQFSILPLLLSWFCVPRAPIILAPRGEFSPGALQFKKLRKKKYIKFAKNSRLYRRVIWHASTQYEAQDIRRELGNHSSVRVALAPDLPAKSAHSKNKRVKRKGALRAIFVSRIAPKKNLSGAIDILSGISSDIEINIFGPIDNRRYWRQCQNKIELLPRNIIVQYNGPVPHEDILNQFADHHLFLFPTHGENYGHVILESLQAGCPVLTSDRTPWRMLDRLGVGWDLDPDDTDGFRRVIEHCAQMGQLEYDQLSQRAYAYSASIADDQTVIDMNRRLFDIELQHL